MKQVNTKGLFKATGDILLADATIKAVISAIILEGTTAGRRTAPFGTLGLDMGRTWDNLPTKDGVLQVSFWIQAKAKSSDITIRDLGDRTSHLLHGDNGKNAINGQGITDIKVRHIEDIGGFMSIPDTRDWKKYAVNFRIILSKSYK